ncbi:unnamed protein product [Hermetia illucens]|uniref:Uncharacterized protein n=2 Tax=Hermetia illucens TaxID=343691 RepID=A0A7R8YP51_HERIL|nr:unnamed protein product [Hermetia illucens]
MWRLLILSLCLLTTLAAKCSLKFAKGRPGIFVQKFGSNRIILSVKDGEVSWDNRAKIEGYCPGGFRNYARHGSDYQAHLTFSCTNSLDVRYQRDDNNGDIARNDGSLSCTTTSKYYEVRIPTCKNKGLAYGFFIGTQAVVLAEVCYNLDLMQTQYLHYIIGPRSPVVESQSTNGFVNVTQSSVDVFIDNSNLQDQTDSLDQAVSIAFLQNLDERLYKLDDLISPSKFWRAFHPYFKDFISVNSIPWWKPLKYFNWGSLEDAIVRLSKNETYDVFAGTSGNVVFLSNDKCSDPYPLTYKVEPHDRNIPLYVWNYIRKKDLTDDGVVVIGINSPFFDSLSKENIICEDICDKLPWFNQLNKRRKMPALGFLFCCKPGEVKDKLDGFPIIQNL